MYMCAVFSQHFLFIKFIEKKPLFFDIVKFLRKTFFSPFFKNNFDGPIVTLG